MKMTDNPNAVGYKKTVGEYVTEDYRTARVFDSYGIDFCCGGNVSLSTVCIEKGLDPDRIIRDMQELKKNTAKQEQDYNSWDLTSLAEHIVKVHHSYLNQNMNSILSYALKTTAVHGDNHPELHKISITFKKIIADMTLHLKTEEEILFPAIKRAEQAIKEGSNPTYEDVDILSNFLVRLKQEHDEVGNSIHEIRSMTNDFSLPEDACNTFMLTYEKLREFENDLHKHVHLENNILFPKAVTLI